MYKKASDYDWGKKNKKKKTHEIAVIKTTLLETSKKVLTIYSTKTIGFNGCL